MFAYLHSASVSALLPKAMGLLFCRSAVPRPTWEPLTCMVTGSEGLKYLRVVSLTMACLTHSKAASYLAFQVKSASFLRSSHRGAVRVDRPQMKGLRYVTMLRNSWSSVIYVGAGRACTASTFSNWGVHHWHHICSQQSLWLGPLHAFSVD